jgi:hypothetical protein
MSFEWLQLRIQEEKDRRQREAEILERLPRTLQDLHGALMDCIEDYKLVFGAEAADIALLPAKIVVTVNEKRDDGWHGASKVEVSLIPSIPGYQIDHGEVSVVIEVGLLPGEKVFYRDREHDKYLTMEELTRRIVDRAFFPKLQA